MKRLFFAGACGAIGWQAAMSWHYKQQSEDNLEKLEWMQQHLGQFKPPATSEEIAYLDSRLEATKTYCAIPSNVLWPPPRVEWERLPMDDAYLEYISKHF